MALRTWTLPVLPKATLEDPNDETLGWTAQHTAGPTQLHAYSPFKYAPYRTDTSTTASSATITDAAITQADSGSLVTGAGIPPYTYVGTVTTGTSYLLSSQPNGVQVNVNATASATVPLVLSRQEYPFRSRLSVPQVAPAAPTVSTSTSGGTLPTGVTYTYGYTYITAVGETLLSVLGTVVTGAGSTNSNTITPPTVPNYATGVNIYGRVGGALGIIATQAVAAAFVDTGAAAIGRANSGLNEATALVNH